VGQEIVKTLKRTTTIVAAIVVIVGVSWFALKRIDCERRNAAFARKIEAIKQDAHEQLKVGTRKAEVSRFFAEHNIPFTIVSPEAFGTSQAIGTLYTSGGCAPLGCGTDNALIGVRVNLDGTGTVTGEPTVIDMYTDCL
jgi:hypothetical protein